MTMPTSGFAKIRTLLIRVCGNKSDRTLLRFGVEPFYSKFMQWDQGVKIVRGKGLFLAKDAKPQKGSAVARHESEGMVGPQVFEMRDKTAAEHDFMFNGGLGAGTFASM